MCDGNIWHESKLGHLQCLFNQLMLLFQHNFNLFSVLITVQLQSSVKVTPLIKIHPPPQKKKTSIHTTHFISSDGIINFLWSSSLK